MTNTFITFKIGDLVQINIDNFDGGLGIIVQDLDYINGIECYYVVYSMRENKMIPMFPYELELVSAN